MKFEKLGRVISLGKAKISAKSPEILIAVGTVGTVAAAVLACKATLKLSSKIEAHHDRLTVTKTMYSDVIEEGKNNPEYKTYQKEIVKDYMAFGWEVTKLYGPSVLLGAASLGTVFASNDILRKRNAALVAACSTVESAFARYRQNVKEAFGEEVDRDMRFGIKTKQVETVETLKNGKEKTKTETVGVVEWQDGYSDYAKFFDSSCKEWTKDPEYNLMYLKAREHEANLKLKAHGYLFLNEVYEMLGIEKTQAGQVVGWVYDPENPLGDNYVDFGIYELCRNANRRFVNGLEDTILLDFNVDGVIIDKI